MKDNAIPKARAPRRVPHSIKEKFKNKLRQLEKINVIEKAEWVQNIAVVAKKDSDDLRICVDATDLNEYILDESFLIPTLEELTACLKGKSISVYSI